MNMMAAAIDKAGSTDPDAIIEALKSIEYKGLTGTTTFDSSNNPVREAIITTVEDGKYKVVKPIKSNFICTGPITPCKFRRPGDGSAAPQGTAAGAGRGEEDPLFFGYRE